MPIASVRVRPANDDNARPERGLLERAAGILQQSGFNVLNIGRFGVSVEGDPQKFVDTLGVKIPENAGFVAKTAPADPALARLVSSVEIAPKATNF